ncbi:hypothetical protein AKJ16_DCAP25712 [Drosera capensis]
MEKMSDLVLERTSSASEAAGSCLTVADKKAVQKPGGCAGIFFQLFDWNRRFAKKKFLPKRLLHLARSKQVSKRFIVEEKLPKSKQFLIAEENSGGFPVGVDGQAKKREMKDLGLVARLMGLETIPAVQKGRKSSVKGSVVDENHNDEQSNCNGSFGWELNEDALGSEKRGERHDWRPQKIRKTGLLSERGSVARLGADALQIKKVISRSRKPHRHKLDSPIISPRGARNASRLIGAATRILEPGLQATSRAKCAIRYSNPMFRSVQEENPANHFPSEYARSGSLSSSLRRKGSCPTCGNLMDETDTKLIMEEQAPLSDLPSTGVEDVFFHALADCNPRPAASREKEIEVVLLKSIDTHDHYPPQAKTTLLAKAETISHCMEPSRESPHELRLPACSSVQNDGMLSVGLKQRVRAQMQKKVLFGEDRLQPRIRVASEQSRRYPSSTNQDNGRNDSSMNLFQVELPSRLYETSKVPRIRCRIAADPLSTPKSSVQKRRTMNVGRQTDGFRSTSSTTEAHRSMKNTTPTVVTPRLGTNPTNRYRGITGQGSRACSTVRGQKDVDIVPKRSSAPLRPKSMCVPALNVKKGDRNDDVDVVSQPKLSVEANCQTRSPQSFLLINQDALGALLEQKLKELTRQAEEESATGIISSTRTTASILQELIAAMTDAKPVTQDDPVKEPDKRDGSCPDDTTSDTAHQAKAWTKQPHAAASVEVDHSSPGSVLVATFSSESCISSSADDTLGNLLLRKDCMDFDHDKPRSTYNDLDFLDSASSSHAHGVTFAPQLLNHISVVLHSANLAYTRPSGTKLEHMKWVISNMALLFADTCSHGAHKFMDFLLGPFLDELGTSARRTLECSILGYGVTECKKLLKRLLLDCLVECMDLRYHRYWNTGFEVWSKLPRDMNTELLIRDFTEEVRKWMLLSRKPIDEIIQSEMSTSVRKWTDFEIEGFESGTEISQAIVQTLVEEVVVDLLLD